MEDRAFLQHVLKDDGPAIEFVGWIFQTCQVWDDLHDQDKDVPPQEVDEVFTWLLCDLPRDPFYQRHAQELQPLIEAAVTDWKTANYFERGTEHQRSLAFVLRESVAGIVIRAAWCVGGRAWSESVAPAIWEFNHDGRLFEYLVELQERDA